VNWIKIVVILEIAALAAWGVGFLVGLVVRFSGFHP
jgi:hypothetical protein